MSNTRKVRYSQQKYAVRAEKRKYFDILMAITRSVDFKSCNLLAPTLSYALMIIDQLRHYMLHGGNLVTMTLILDNKMKVIGKCIATTGLTMQIFKMKDSR